MCATVFYTKLIKGKLYPKAARVGLYAYANEVSRERGKVVSRYIGILKLPDDAGVEERADVVKNGGKADADHTREPE